MSNKDLPVIVYKLLAYIYTCMQNEVAPTVEQAKKLCEANDTMFETAVSEAVSNGFLNGASSKFYYSGPEVSFSNPRLTLAGVEFLLENSSMQKAKSIAGRAFEIALEQVISMCVKASTM